MNEENRKAKEEEIEEAKDGDIIQANYEDNGETKDGSVIRTSTSGDALQLLDNVTRRDVARWDAT